MQTEHHNKYLPYKEDNFYSQFFLWFFVTVFFIISTLGLSFAIFLTINSEWDIAEYYSNSYLDFAFSVFPTILLPFILIGLLLVIILFKLTNLGKKNSFYYSFSIVSFFIFFFSFLFFYLGVGKFTDNILDNYSFYKLITKNRDRIWQNPSFGLLSGEVGTIKDLDNFILMDFNNHLWTIQSTDPKIVGNFIIHPGDKIKIIGSKSNETVFEAHEIRHYK